MGTQVHIMGTDTGQTMQSLPLVMVTSAVPGAGPAPAPSPAPSATPSPAPSPAPAGPPARGTPVSIQAAFDQAGSGSLWLTDTRNCAGPPGFCPAYLTATDAGVITNLNIFASTGMSVMITGMATGQTIGGVPVIMVTAAVPTGLSQINQLLQPLGLDVGMALAALGNLGISVMFGS